MIYIGIANMFKQHLFSFGIQLTIAKQKTKKGLTSKMQQRQPVAVVAATSDKEQSDRV